MTILTIGTAEIRPVLEMQLRNRPIAWLGADRSVVDANRDWLAPHFLEAGDSWSLNFQTWVMNIDDKVVVVDPCTGNDRPHPIAPFDMLDIPFIERFSATGTRPEDVDYVFCTHMHHDHCGWNTQLLDGRWVSTFPNARYIFVRREYDRWHPDRPGHRAVDYKQGVFERSIQPIVEAGLADLVLDQHALLPGLQVQPAHGHTLGHSMLSLASRGQEAIFTGDAFHHPLQLVDPALQFGDCDDAAEATETRRRLACLSIERDLLLIPAHLPFPHAGRVGLANGNIVFHPVEIAGNDSSD